MTSEATARKGLPANVILLGIVSLLNDIASEMVYPLLPFFLMAMGGTAQTVGSIEAVAEAVPSLLKGYFGKLADKPQRRKPLAGGGYALSALGKAVLAVVSHPLGVAASRWTDRIGKGVRTSARDAMLSATTPKEKLGLAFGVHRAMDSSGAVIGPLLAYLFLRSHAAPKVGDFRAPFLWATVFAIAGTLVLFLFVKDDWRKGEKKSAAVSADRLPRAFWVVLIAGTLFALGNSSDMLLLARTDQILGKVSVVALVYAFYNTIYAAASAPLGALADRIGPRVVLTAGYVVFAAVYLGFALGVPGGALWGLWAVYGLYIAATDGVQKALVAHLVPQERRASAYGVLGMAVGVSALPANLLAGFLYKNYGPGAAFGLSTGLAACAAVVLAMAPLKEAM